MRFSVVTCNIEHIMIMNGVKKTLLFASPLILLMAMLFFTSPYKLPLFLLLVPFFLIGIGCFVALYELLKPWSMSTRKRKVIAVALSSLLLLGTLLQSIRQLSVKDILILLALFAGLAFYLRRIDV